MKFIAYKPAYGKCKAKFFPLGHLLFIFLEKILQSVFPGERHYPEFCLYLFLFQIYLKLSHPLETPLNE